MEDINRLKIYFVHSDSIDYNNKIYLPVLRSNYLSKHKLVFKNNNENKEKYFKDLIVNSDVFVVELSNVDYALLMEIREVINTKRPVLALANLEKGYDSKVEKYLSDIVMYTDEEEFRKLIEEFVKKYEGKIINGAIDPTIVLGVIE